MSLPIETWCEPRIIRRQKRRCGLSLWRNNKVISSWRGRNVAWWVREENKCEVNKYCVVVVCPWDGAGRNMMKIIMSMLAPQTYVVLISVECQGHPALEKSWVEAAVQMAPLESQIVLFVISHRPYLEISSCCWVLCARWTEKGRAVARKVSRWPLTAKARVRSQASPCGICGGQSGAGTRIFLRVQCFVFVRCRHFVSAPYSLIYHRRCIILAIDITVK
jgi:hypothetical protein